MRHSNHSISDESLRSAILAIFSSDNQIASANLRLGVLNGIAHLAGRVHAMEKRDAVEEHVGQIAGVHGIVNRIEAPGAPSPSRTIHLNLSHSKRKYLNEVFHCIVFCVIHVVFISLSG